jgi:peptidoglycan/xylan/chitin deacetylase (PgdA/CDA1 family)
MHSAILTYHSLDDSGSVISTPVETFRTQMRSLVERGIPVSPLEEVAAGKPAVALTFDDGYANFAESALPVLEKFSLPATVFVVSGRCGEWSDWHGLPGIPHLRLMDWAALCSLPGRLVSLGSHTVTHPDLTHLDPTRVRAELVESRNEIEQRSGRPAPSLAYPYGSVNEPVRTAARSSYGLAVGTKLQYASAAADSMAIPRIDSYYLRRQSVFEKVTGANADVYLFVRRCLRELRSAVRGGS